MKQNKIRNFALCIFGSLIYCLGFSCFIKHANLFSGGFVGISQLFCIPFQNTTLAKYDLQGIFYFIINIPIFIIAWIKFGKKYIAKSLFLVAFESFLFSIIPPVPQLISDTLTNCIIGGCIEGIGISITFLGFGSGGGTDLLGILLTKKFKNLSVGKVSLFVDIAVYIACGFLFSFEVAIYSFIASIFSSILIDKLHKQNNSVSINILSSKYEEIKRIIIEEVNRDATIIDSVGAFSNENKKMIVSIMSEYEFDFLVKRVKEIDKDAFIYVLSNVSVFGNFEKRIAKV